MDCPKVVGSYRLNLKSKVMLALARVTTALTLVRVAFLWTLKVVRSRLVADYLFAGLRNRRGSLLVALGVRIRRSHFDRVLLLDAVLRTILLYLLRGVIQLVRSSMLTRLVSILLLVLKLRSSTNRLWSSLANRV